MSSEQRDSVIRRKAQSGLNERQARAMSVQKALRVTLAKVADEMLDMAMSALGVTSDVLGIDDCVALFDPANLLVLLDGPERKTAAAVLDPALVGALIQQQTMGLVTDEPPGAEPRKLTETDAAMCAPFLDTLLARTALLPEDDTDRVMLEGFRFGARAEDARLLQMALEEPQYRVLKLTVDIAGGRRQGKLTLVFPPVQSQLHSARSTAEDGTEADLPAASRLLDETVLSLQADLSVALTRLRMPLSKVTALTAGDVLTLDIANLAAAMVLGADGKKVCSGALGQVDGMRALKLEPPKRRSVVPQRRASDREALNLPEVAPVFDRRTEAADSFDAAAMPEIADGLPDLPELPDMSDLPELSGMDDAAALPDLPELPDMPDLPDLDDLPDLPDIDLKAG